METSLHDIKPLFLGARGPDYREEGRRRKREEGEKIGKAVVEGPVLVVCQRVGGWRGRPICARRHSRWQLWKQIDFHSAAMMHEWKHAPGVTRALSRAGAAAGRRLPSSFPPSCHFPPPLPLSRPLPDKHQHLNLNATSGAQIKSFTVHREQRRLATIQPAGESACFLSAPPPSPPPSPPPAPHHTAPLRHATPRRRL